MEKTTWKFYTSSPEIWEAMIKACEEAQEYIDFEQFNFTPDDIGNRFIEVCKKKVSEGVKVRFLWDAAGSFTFFSSSIVDELKKKGIELLFFKTLLPGFSHLHDYRSWYFRNHRRTLVVDKKVAFTGSICISKDKENWRETQVQLMGPVVNDMQLSFEKMWNRAKGRRMPRIQQQDKSDYEFEYVVNNPLPGSRHLYKRIIEAIRNSKKYIYIAVPYFVPTHRLWRVLHLARLRGVDVRIMLPEQSDYPIVDLGARTFFHSLLKTGIRIFLFQKKMLHCKTVVIDGDWTSVGTLNMDTISLLYNFEANLVSSNHQFAEEVTNHFIEDLKNCREVTLNEWQHRSLLERISTFLVGFVRDFI